MMIDEFFIRHFFLALVVNTQGFSSQSSECWADIYSVPKALLLRYPDTPILRYLFRPDTPLSPYLLSQSSVVKNLISCNWQLTTDHWQKTTDNWLFSVTSYKKSYQSLSTGDSGMYERLILSFLCSFSLCRAFSSRALAWYLLISFLSGFACFFSGFCGFCSGCGCGLGSVPVFSFFFFCSCFFCWSFFCCSCLQWEKHTPSSKWFDTVDVSKQVGLWDNYCQWWFNW